MNIKGQTVGDIKIWATKVLHDDLERIINAKSSFSLPYYILIIMKEGYQGPPTKSKGTKTVDMSGKRVMTHRFILLNENRVPAVPLIGSALVYVNNKTGQVKFMYILPPDKPMIGGFDVELESETVLKCGQNMPYIYGTEN